ncbi:conserved hypothetical protein [Candida dubliniensis CD36]|uniref:Uncharacterized protein n=1 Tax=Candida dubliniensis (strain CD36 / ATCC MYA-646 / CBS 7987 / NCPF 3949 / NRRL Y-17841) TaxID=573826 RepID=B9W9Q9_CANDC|nr:conserved hypothetical protein [Candida dubliniensis CD36]CAX45544.1 conserved hypothetical protein [Candida dubliniensis CD36]
MPNFVELNVFGIPIALGKTLSNGGIKVKNVSDSDEWPWPIMQRPLKQGASISYDRYSGVYIKGVKLRGSEVPDGSYGIKIGKSSCIGIYVSTDDAVRKSKNEIDTTINVSREQFSSKIDSNKVRCIILHSDGTTDIQYISSGNINSAGFGVVSGSSSTGLGNEYLEVIESGVSVDVPTLF